MNQDEQDALKMFDFTTHCPSTDDLVLHTWRETQMSAILVQRIVHSGCTVLSSEMFSVPDKNVSTIHASHFSILVIGMTSFLWRQPLRIS